MSTLPEIRRAFWDRALASEAPRGVETYRDSNAILPLTGAGDVCLAFGIQQDGSSIFLRSPVNASRDVARLRLEPRQVELRRLLATPFEAEGDAGQGRYFRKRVKLAFTQKSQWDGIVEWFGRCRARYEIVITETLEAP
ncbi:hypothetical protein [Wenxinia saemankumensis]|uniref:Uncharacterized protein n=1 Tax=Wenxinia saemankumensis TaxID=1447782 RepID=A0A1M6D4P6_9RHOB|nr:hypothetical protein [Wenxinia saemankumensis]SHI67968.1 hypothetical protein SAMN05444417_1509 [Wenxinia saemankumensis]